MVKGGVDEFLLSKGGYRRRDWRLIIGDRLNRLAGRVSDPAIGVVCEFV